MAIDPGKTNQQNSLRVISSRQERMIAESILVEQEDAKSAGAIGYMAQILVQIALPHQKVDTIYYDPPRNGNLSLSIRAHKAYGVPYGAKARLIMSWFATEAVRTQSPVLLLGRSQRDFAMNKLKFNYTGRELTALKHQCLALMRAIISIDTDMHCNAIAFRDIQISSKGFICWNDKSPDQSALWESTLVLSDDYYKTVTNNPVPIDTRAYKMLSKSPMSMDIYAWFTYRMFTLWRSGLPNAKVPWKYVKEMFGHEYANTDEGMRNFKKRFRSRSKDSLLYLQDYKNHIEETAEYLILTPCRPVIEPTKIYGNIVHNSVKKRC